MEPVTCTCCGKIPETGFVRLFSHQEMVVCYWCLDGLIGQRERAIAGQTGGWRISGHEPILKVADVPRAMEHYSKLGFETSEHDDTYAFAEREGQITIHLTHDDGGGFGPGELYLHVDDAEVVAREWRLAGLAVEGPENQDYGKCEGSHVDPDGNIIRFGSPVRSD